MQFGRGIIQYLRATQSITSNHQWVPHPEINALTLLVHELLHETSLQVLPLPQALAVSPSPSLSLGHLIYLPVTIVYWLGTYWGLHLFHVARGNQQDPQWIRSQHTNCGDRIEDISSNISVNNQGTGYLMPEKICQGWLFCHQPSIPLLKGVSITWTFGNNWGRPTTISIQRARLIIAILTKYPPLSKAFFTIILGLRARMLLL